MPSPEPKRATGQPTLAGWLLRLGPVHPPVDPAVRDAALEELAENRGSASALALCMLADPALALLLFRAANRALARYDRSVHTLEHAISLLGAKRVQQLLSEAPLLAADHPHATAYRQAQLRSLHAAWQARLWAEGSGRWQAEDIFWSTLLAGAPLWPLWIEAGHIPLELERLRVGQGAVSAAQERQLLGCRLKELAAALAEYWLLPDNSRLSWHGAAAGSGRQWLALARAARLDDPPVLPEVAAEDRSYHPALPIAVANALALESDWDWYSPRSLRLLRIAASACRRPLATLIGHCHRTAAEMSRFHADCGLLTPAARLLGHWREIDYRRPPQPAAPVAAAVPAAPENQAIIAGAVKRLRTPSSIAGPRAALELALTALHRGLGLERVAVMLHRGATGELQTLLGAGIEENGALRRFRHTPAPRSLLGQLLQKPVCLSLDTDNRAKLWPLLPEVFRAAVDCDTFLLMSVFAGSKPTALIYADNGAGPPPSARQQQLFKQICQLLSQCLERLGQAAPGA